MIVEKMRGYCCYLFTRDSINSNDCKYSERGKRQVSTVIVFSKDRPMQLHAYLESLIRASGCLEEQIYVLYKEIQPICYTKTKAFFRGVNWIPEEDFDGQIRQLVADADDYILFGCDDVVFVNGFELQKMERYLAAHEEIFGFSLRLGKNIRPFPKRIQKDGEVCSWSWEENTSHYGYPWELDCTLYRKRDVLEILQKMKEVRSPNYLESIPEENPQVYVRAGRMAAYYERGSAIVITVNRVQDTHPNQVDGTGRTDVLSLFIQYHYEGRLLALDKLWKCKSDKVHVGNKYFQLTDSVVSDIHITEGVKLGKLCQLIRNLRFLSGESMEKVMQKQVQDAMIADRLQAMAQNNRRSTVLGPEATVRRLSEQPKSFCRFGDGEFRLMLGDSIGFQKYEPELALALWEIFCMADDNMYIGVPYQQFEAPSLFNDWIRTFYFTSGAWIRKFLYQYLSGDRELYIDTGFNQVYQTYQNMNFFAYYEHIKELFRNKKIMVIAGEGILAGLDVDIFEYAVSTEYLYSYKADAFDEYDKILKEALNIDKNRLICVILGPCSKLIVRDLTKAGYMAWDIGHLVKDYDAYKKRKGRSKEDIACFYAPD